MDIELIAGPAIAGALGLAGVGLTVWAQGRREHRRGWLDLDSSKHQLDLMAAWLDVNDKLNARDAMVDLPPSFVDDLRGAYARANRGADMLTEHPHKNFWPRARAVSLPPFGRLSGWASLWRVIYYVYAALAACWVVPFTTSFYEGWGPMRSAGEAVWSVAWLILVLLIFVAGPLATFRALSLAATKRGRSRTALAGGVALHDRGRRTRSLGPTES